MKNKFEKDLESKIESSKSVSEKRKEEIYRLFEAIKNSASVPFRESEFWKKHGHLATPGTHMRTYREIAGWSQTELGQKLGGIARSHISEYESGKRSIDKDVAKKLAKLFKTSVEIFI
ncbi:helix-turn-helix domain-containing protein [Leptospira interrogans]|nr:helix-turn-helix transcriptional regulator [Leptospira interrogans]